MTRFEYSVTVAGKNPGNVTDRFEMGQNIIGDGKVWPVSVDEMEFSEEGWASFIEFSGQGGYHEVVDFVRHIRNESPGVTIHASIRSGWEDI